MAAQHTSVVEDTDVEDRSEPGDHDSRERAVCAPFVVAPVRSVVEVIED